MVQVSDENDFPEIAGLLAHLRYDMPYCDANRVGAELYGAPRLSLMVLLDPKEPALSRLFANLFDPEGLHGQGPLFLNAMLGALGLPCVVRGNAVRVTTEAMTAKGGRIDILINTPRALIGIENKPWARQREFQLADYHRELKSRQGDQAHLLFLSNQEPAPGVDVLKLPFYSLQTKATLHSVLSSLLGEIMASKTKALV
jgi:hypothetical protein